MPCDLSITITLTASEPLLAVLNRIADALQRPMPNAAPVPLPVQAVSPGALETFVTTEDAAEGPGRAAASTLPAAEQGIAAAGPFSGKGRVHSAVWLTPERKALLIELYPTEPVFQVVFDKVAAASPGVPMPDRQALRNKALVLGVRRPPEAQMLSSVARTNLASSRRAPALQPAPEPLADSKPPAAAPPIPRPQLVPIAATQNQIHQECQKRGWVVGSDFDIDAINRKFRSLGHPGFVLATPARRSA